jgi:NADP-dependent 3-hydroxy acid dehydrogenase YdfG
MQVLKDKIVFISGASSGIGQACADVFAQAGAKLILCARNIAKIRQIAQDLKDRHQTDILALELDVQDKKAVNKAIDSLSPDWRRIDILINNAGLALGLEKLYEGDSTDWETMIDTNIKGLLYLTRKIVPNMLHHKLNGHVINIGSIAGIHAYPGGAVYCASKAAVRFISDGLRMDVVDTPIRVTNIQPGMVHTNFSVTRFHGNQQKADKVYDGITPLAPMDIANVVVYAASAPAHVQICEVTVTPTCQATGGVVHREGK